MMIKVINGTEIDFKTAPFLQVDLKYLKSISKLTTFSSTLKFKFM